MVHAAADQRPRTNVDAAIGTLINTNATIPSSIARASIAGP